MSIRIGILGYGNLGKGVEKAVNMKIKGVATGAVMNRDENTDWIGSFKVVDTSCNFAEGW